MNGHVPLPIRTKPRYALEVALLAREEIDQLIAALSKGQVPAAHANALRLRVALELLKARRRRVTFFPDVELADPAWDMLLDLYCARLGGKTVTISSLCFASGVPATTALRWIKLLTTAGYVEREPDRCDRRRSQVTLTGDAAERMDRWIDGTVAEAVA